MSDGRRRLFPDQNPFATFAVKPGAIEFDFCGTVSAASLVTKLRENLWRGQIVGPHGSGKSTLLQTLIPVIRTDGRKVRLYGVGDDQQLPLSEADQATWTRATQIVIEGYELLSRRHHILIDRGCREKQAGLLITCHKPQGLPTLFHTSVTIELAQSIVQQLLPEDCELITQADVRDSFIQHGQNLRELLFAMYDLYEQRRRRQSHRSA